MGSGINVIRQLTADSLIKYYPEVLHNIADKMAAQGSSDLHNRSAVVQEFYCTGYAGITGSCTSSSLWQGCFHSIINWIQQDRDHCHPPRKKYDILIYGPLHLPQKSL